MKKLVQSKILYPEILWERPVHSYKARAGKILVLAGSKGNTPAAILTCEALFRSGTGILTLGYPDRLTSFFKEVIPEAMRLPLPSTLSESLAKRGEPEILEQARAHDILVIGPGLSTNAETMQLTWELIFKVNKPIVLDEDGITALTKGIEVIRSQENEGFLLNYFSKKEELLILVTYPGELVRILHAINLTTEAKPTPKDYKKNPEKMAGLISKTLNCYTVVRDGDIVMTEPLGNAVVTPSQAKTPDKNDVLAGVISSFVGQNPQKVLKSITTAIYLYAASLNLAKEEAGERPLKTADIIRYLPKAIKKAEME